MKKMRVLIAFGSYRVGDEIEVTGLEGDFLRDRHFAEEIKQNDGALSKEQAPKKRGRPRKSTANHYVA